MSVQAAARQIQDQLHIPQRTANQKLDRHWYAVFTFPQHEKAVANHLAMREIESFLPTYERVRVWKNRQRKKIVSPLFPTYLFVHIDSGDRTKILQSPGVIRLVGNGSGSIPLLDSEIEFIRSSFCERRVEPFSDLPVGTRVRIKRGPMQGVQGTLVRKSDCLRFVITLELINQHAAIQVGADELEPILN